MNANELADELEKILQHETSWDIDFVETIAMQAATMLRQQQAEIERFKNNYMALFQDFTKQQAKIEEMLDALIAVEVWLSSGCGTNFEAKVNSAIRKAQEK